MSKKEYTDAQVIEYNNFVTMVSNNILVERVRMNNTIILWDFQPDQEMDRLYYNVATLLSDVFDEPVYLDMKLFSFLIFKWKRRKGRKNLKRVHRLIRNEIEINDRTSIYEIMTFIQQTAKADESIYENINDCFYGEWIK